MLSLAFANGFIYFYIGNGNHPLAKIAKDCASAAVCLSIGTAAITWAWMLFALAFGE